MTRKSCLLILAFLSITWNLWSWNSAVGIRGSFSGGYPSGKGLWDWTGTDSPGSLFWGGGAGAGMVFREDLNRKFSLETGLSYFFLQGGQRIGSVIYTYSQKSLEIPLILKVSLPFEDRRWTLNAGPVLILIPFDARRVLNRDGNTDSLDSTPGKQAMAALQAGFDFQTFSSENREIALSFNFTHPVTSPDYSWEPLSSGSVRINRIDLSVTLLHKTGHGK